MGGCEQTAKINMVRFFNKHLVKGEKITQCSKDLGISITTLHKYKHRDDYRQLALAHLDNCGQIGGVKGALERLESQLEAVRPIQKETVDKEGATSIEIEYVPDNRQRMVALQEIFKIYGLYAPTKTDVTVAISLSSDEDLFSQIESAERKCRYVESQEVEQGSSGMDAGEPKNSRGNFSSRGRTLLQHAPVPEQD